MCEPENIPRNLDSGYHVKSLRKKRVGIVFQSEKYMRTELRCCVSLITGILLPSTLTRQTDVRSTGQGPFVKEVPAKIRIFRPPPVSPVLSKYRLKVLQNDEIMVRNGFKNIHIHIRRHTQLHARVKEFSLLFFFPGPPNLVNSLPSPRPVMYGFC